MAEVIYHYDEDPPWVEETRSADEWLKEAEKLSQHIVQLSATETYNMIVCEESLWCKQAWTNKFMSYMHLAGFRTKGSRR